MIARYNGFLFFLALLMGVGGSAVALEAEYPPMNTQWSNVAAGNAVDHSNPWRKRELNASNAQFVQPSGGNPWLKGGRTQQTVNVYPSQQGQVPQMMPVLPQRRGMKAWSSPQSFPFGWMP